MELKFDKVFKDRDISVEEYSKLYREENYYDYRNDFIKSDRKINDFYFIPKFNDFPIIDYDSVIKDVRDIVNRTINSLRVTFFEARGIKGEYRPDAKEVAINKSMIKNATELKTVLLHEFRHAEQCYNKILEIEHKHIYWYGNRFDVNHVRASHYNYTLYNELPWEIDANAYAYEFTGYYPEGMDHLKTKGRAF